MGSNGQSLIEVIIVMMVGILVVVALTFATIFSLRNANFAKTSAQATKLAQEGIERVRTGRDRNSAISGTPTYPTCDPSCPVSSWNGTNPTAGDSIWDDQLYNACGSGMNCYFKFAATSGSDLNFITTSSNFPSSGTESIAPGFNRAIILSDDATSYQTQKTITVIVRWTDATGAHDSKLTTVLRKL